MLSAEFFPMIDERMRSKKVSGKYDEKLELIAFDLSPQCVKAHYKKYQTGLL